MEILMIFAKAYGNDAPYYLVGAMLCIAAIYSATRKREPAAGRENVLKSAQNKPSVNNMPPKSEVSDDRKNPQRKIFDHLARQLTRGEHRGENDYYYDPRRRNVEFTYQGIKKIESFFSIDNMKDPQNAVIKGTLESAIIEKETKQR